MSSLRVLGVVLVHRPLISLLLSVFYVLDVLIAVTGGRREHYVVVMLMLLMLPTVGVFAMSTERIRALALASEELGVPGYRNRLLSAQWGVIALFILLPMAGLIAAGADPLLAALLVAHAGFGVMLVLFGRWVILGVGGVFVLNKLGTSVDELFLQPWVRLALLGGGVWMLAYWLLNLLKPRTLARAAPTFADSRQEVNAHTVADATGQTVDQVERYSTRLDQRITALTQSINRGDSSLQAVCFGIGLDPQDRARAIVVTIGVAVFALGVWNAVYGSRSDVGGYGVFTAFAVITTLSRVETVSRTLRRTVVEQSILALTPKWPSRRELKAHLARLIVGRLVAPGLVWCAVTALAVVVRWISIEWALSGAIVYIAAASAAVACLLIELTRKSTRWETLLNSAIVLSSVVGAAIWIVAALHHSRYQLVGVLVIAMPLSAAVGMFWLKRLQFPVTVRGPVS